MKIKSEIKVQLISKGLFGVLNSSKKRTKKYELTTMQIFATVIPQIVSDRFLEELNTSKRNFEIN